MLFALVLSVDKDVIEVHYYEDVELFCQDLVDVTLKRDWYVGQSKRHDLILEMTIVGPKCRLPFVSFPNPHLMVVIGQIQLGEMPSPT